MPRIAAGRPSHLGAPRPWSSADGRRSDTAFLVSSGVLILALCAWNARGVLLDPLHRAWGTGLDAQKNVWAAWWASTARFSTFTRYVSFPDGEYGTTASPVGNLLTAPILALAGPTAAYNAQVVFYLFLALVGVALVVRALTGSRPAMAVACLAMLVGRPVFGQITDGTVEGLAVGWLLLGCACGLRWTDGGGAGRGGVLVGACFFAAVLESPYQIFVAPPLALLFAARRLRRPGGIRELCLAAAAGGLPAALHLGMSAKALGPTSLGEPRWVDVRGGLWPYWDLSAGGLQWMFHPLAASSDLPMLERPHTLLYLGASALALAALGLLDRRGWVATLFGLYAALLAAGSLPLGEDSFPGPFLFLNGTLSRLGTHLGSPPRLLGVASAALAVGAGCGVASLRRRWPAWATALTLLTMAGLTLDGALWGAATVPPPSTAIPSFSCMRGIARDGALHIVIAPRAADVWDHAEDTPRQALPYLAHAALRLPASLVGFYNWTKAPRTPAVWAALAVVDRAIVEDGGRIPAPAVATLQDVGFSWVLVPDSLWNAGLPRPRAACDGLRLVALADLAAPGAPR